MKRLLLVWAGVLSGCTMPASLRADDACTGDGVDPYRELLVVDPEMLAPAKGESSVEPWSPRAVLEVSSAGVSEPSSWLARGIERWRDAARLDGRERVAEALDTGVLCAWLRATPENGCDATCGTCAAQVYAVERAPFRTLAVVNRTDLRSLPDARTPAGEGRVVLGLVTPGTERPDFGLTVIFEYALGGSVRDWAERWHALGALDDAAARPRLGDLVRAFVGAPPLPDGAPALSQVRVSIRVDEGATEMRELALDADGELVPRGLRNTPRLDLDGTSELDAVAKDQADRIVAGAQLVPHEMLASAQAYGAHAWSLPSVDPATRLEFDRGTCAGCHANSGTDGGFHVSPFETGRAGVSHFLHDPSADDDELRRRERELGAALCAD